MLAAFGAAAAISAAASCGRTPQIALDPEVSSFEAKERILMTEPEAETYKSLPDQAAKIAFIRDFWKLRDPYPETDANEFRTEFEERAAFANKWFSRFDAIRGRDVPGKTHPEDGCTSGRGMVYVLLGPPDRMSLLDSDMENSDVRIPWFRRITDENDFYAEIWYYNRLKVHAGFGKTSAGRWELSADAPLANRLNDARRWPIEEHYGSAGVKPLTFESKYGGGAIELEIPAECITLNEARKGSLEVMVNVWRDGMRVGQIQEKKSIDFSAEESKASRTISFVLPFKPEKPGRHVFEVIVEDVRATCFSRRHEVVTKKF